MKIDVYKTLTSVRPFTSWRSYADMANFLEENGEIAAICKKIDETGNKELKSGLPLMMPMTWRTLLFAFMGACMSCAP